MILNNLNAKVYGISLNIRTSKINFFNTVNFKNKINADNRIDITNFQNLKKNFLKFLQILYFINSCSIKCDNALKILEQL